MATAAFPTHSTTDCFENREGRRMATPFVPKVDEGAVRDMLAQVKASKIRDTYEGRTDGFGIKTEWMRSTMKYWTEQFQWSAAMDRIRSVDHYKVDVEGREVHFVGHFSSDPKAIPLLLLHGWPGCFLEFIDTIKILRESTEPSFTLICPSQPGYAWSSPPPLDRDYGIHDVAALMNALMIKLGFQSGYAAQGGDIGSVIARILAVKYDSCKAININYLPLPPPDSVLSLALSARTSSWIPASLSSTFNTLTKPMLGDVSTFGLSDREIKNSARAAEFLKTGRGYGIIQGTRPATIAVALGSSPVALLAWLGEKLQEWTEVTPSLDRILETVTLWWVLDMYPTSIYPYRELTSGVGGMHADPKLYVSKPMGFSSFAFEIASAPKMWAARTGNLQYYAYYEHGDHFAAASQPQVFADSMKECFGKIYPR